MIKNEVKLVGTIVRKSEVKVYESGQAIYFSLECNGKEYRVQAWDDDCSYIANNTNIGDVININGYFNPYYDKAKKEHKWYIKTRSVGTLPSTMATCTIDGVINSDNNTRQNKEKGIINFTLKTDRDHSNVVYCNAPESLASFIVKDSHIFIEGDFDLSDPSRVIIDVKKISYTQDF